MQFKTNKYWFPEIISNNFSNYVSWIKNFFDKLNKKIV
jgi:hypothetical protein